MTTIDNAHWSAEAAENWEHVITALGHSENEELRETKNFFVDKNKYFYAVQVQCSGCNGPIVNLNGQTYNHTQDSSNLIYEVLTYPGFQTVVNDVLMDQKTNTVTGGYWGISIYRKLKNQLPLINLTSIPNPTLLEG